MPPLIFAVIVQSNLIVSLKNFLFKPKKLYSIEAEMHYKFLRLF